MKNPNCMFILGCECSVVRRFTACRPCNNNNTKLRFILRRVREKRLSLLSEAPFVRIARFRPMFLTYSNWMCFWKVMLRTYLYRPANWIEYASWIRNVIKLLYCLYRIWWISVLTYRKLGVTCRLTYELFWMICFFFILIFIY